MCIISQPVESVSETRIYVGVNEARTTQIVVYSMSIEHRSRGPTPEMLLPVPATIDTVELLDFSSPLLRRWNDILHRQFNSLEGLRTLGASRGIARGVITRVVGSYEIRLYPSIDVYTDLHPEVPASVISTLRKRYSPADTLLAAVLLDSGNYHPLAFTFPVCSQGLYVPTYHLHHGKTEEISDWDHHIFYEAPPLEITEQDEKEAHKRGDTHILSKLGVFGKYTIDPRQAHWAEKGLTPVATRMWRYGATLEEQARSGQEVPKTENNRHFLPLLELYTPQNPYREYLPSIADLRQRRISGRQFNSDIWLPHAVK